MAKTTNDTEKELDTELTKTEVNIKKATPEELRKVPLNAKNAQTITKKILSTEKRVKIKIPSTDKEKTAIFVSVNGVAYNIPRDTEWEVPMSVVKVLENAIVREYRIVESKDADSAKIVAEDRQRIVFSSKE